MHESNQRRAMFKVLSPVEKKDGSTFWMRVGTGFPGKDPTTFNLYLDAVPLHGKGMLHMREMDEDELQKTAGRKGSNGTPAGASPIVEDAPF